MTRIFWDTIFLISGSLFTFGAGPNNTTITEASVSIDTNSTAAPNTSTRSIAVTNSARTTLLPSITDIPTDESSFITLGAEQTNSTTSNTGISTDSLSSEALYNSTNSSATTSRSTTTTTTAAATSVPPVKRWNLYTGGLWVELFQSWLSHKPSFQKSWDFSPEYTKFLAAAVRSHFDDCPDSHRHFCFHGTCRFLILEEVPACVCHPGFVGMRCEHADLLAVVATNHRQQTVATMLVLCVIGCVLIMVFCTLLHCWWRQDCQRRRLAHHYSQEKHGASCYPSESVV